MDDDKNEISKPQEQHQSSGKRKITFFNSFEEAKDHGRKEMALMTPVQRLESLEQMRRFFLRQFLLSDGKWPMLERIITIKEGTYK